MAFCNSCGATLEAGARFCPKCGTAIPMAAALPAVVPASPAASPQGSRTLKIMLIVGGVVLAIGILGIGTLTFVVRRIAHRHRVDTNDGNVRVERPFGAVQSSNDPDEASRNLGIDMYPGARVLTGNTAAVGSMHTVEAELESDDSAEKVMAFYTSKLPNANVTTKDRNHYTIVSTDKKNLITINIEPEGSKTHITIANVSGKNMTGDGSPD
jgi:zinc-ribbon domain